MADSPAVYQRGVRIFNAGGYFCKTFDAEGGRFEYEVDGHYGDYLVVVEIEGDSLKTRCSCPYPAEGCKHTVAMLLDLKTRLRGSEGKATILAVDAVEYLTIEEIRAQALADRKARAKSEHFVLSVGDMYKGEHIIETTKGRTYTVVMHDPVQGIGHCSCPDFQTNQMGTCKHILHLTNFFHQEKDFAKIVKTEQFPFINIFWDSVSGRPRMFHEKSAEEIADIAPVLNAYFDADGGFTKTSPTEMLPFIYKLSGDKRIRIEDSVLFKLDDVLQEQNLRELSRKPFPLLDFMRVPLYPYQQKGIAFGLYRKAVLIGDEMGLGKTVQAIALAILKREIMGFNKVVVITLASLKEQWKREIEKFTHEKAVVVMGNPDSRRAAYDDDKTFFKITNYEAVRRDVRLLETFGPDLVILDEAQRIKNFETKTAEAVKSIPKKQAIVLTGTPLENKLEDVYSIVQFLDPGLLAPLWRFAGNHFMLSRDKKGKILGYRNLDQLHETLKSIVIRRRKEEVLDDLPELVENNYYLDLTFQQREIHNSFASSIIPLLHKKFLTPMDLQRLQKLLLQMRMVCDSTYLIDRETNESPKLKELENVLDELVVQNNRKVVIFSEWTTMTYLIAKHLSKVKIDFVELTGKVPVPKRQALIDEFSHNPDCKVFLASDAGGTGLNLQAADCVINFEPPWNPAKINQRVGRVNRIGQKKSTINVINLITRNSIEERILAGLQLKTDLFQGVFDGTIDQVEFSQEKRQELVDKLKGLIEEEQALAKSVRENVPEEIPADMPHYLNPKVLDEQEGDFEYDAEEGDFEETPLEDVSGPDHPGENGGEKPLFEGQPAEKIEEVLNSGLSFLSGLMEMATGRKLEKTGDQGKMIRIDKESGEVTMTFKLPGF